jgi:hypothetical protein
VGSPFYKGLPPVRLREEKFCGPDAQVKIASNAALVAESDIITRLSDPALLRLTDMFPRLYECKDCGGFNGYRSRPKNLTERFLLPLLLLRPTRCGDCFKRSYQSMFVKVRPRREPKKAQNAIA